MNLTINGLYIETHCVTPMCNHCGVIATPDILNVRTVKDVLDVTTSGCVNMTELSTVVAEISGMKLVPVIPDAVLMVIV